MRLDKRQQNGNKTEISSPSSQTAKEDRDRVFVSGGGSEEAPGRNGPHGGGGQESRRQRVLVIVLQRRVLSARRPREAGARGRNASIVGVIVDGP
jgi:hypothetical protein